YTADNPQRRIDPSGLLPSLGSVWHSVTSTVSSVFHGATQAVTGFIRGVSQAITSGVRSAASHLYNWLIKGGGAGSASSSPRTVSSQDPLGSANQNAGPFGWSVQYGQLSYGNDGPRIGGLSPSGNSVSVSPYSFQVGSDSSFHANAGFDVTLSTK